MEIKKLTSENIPKRIKEIPDFPTQLYIAGKLAPANLKNLVIVGSRKHSSYGKQVVQDIIAGLAGYPINIVSGLALGLDALAHEEALRHGMHTTAFVGSGLSPRALHPQTNIRLAEKIVESGGCLLSEYEPDFKATQYSFPQRNRLKAAYAHAVLIIEAEEKSGTLITARMALDYNRDVLVIPGSIYSATSRGTNWLLSQGAHPVTRSDDVLRYLGFEVRDKFTRTDISEEEQVIFDILREPLTRDEIIRNCNGTTEEINSLLMKMELRNLILEDAGYFRKL